MGWLRRLLMVAVLGLLVLQASCGRTPVPRPLPPAPDPTPGPRPPLLLEIAEQFTFPGRPFDPLTLDDWASDVDTPVTALSWSVTGTAELVVTITERVAVAAPAEPAWRGSETIRLQACDPTGLCDSTAALFTVLEQSQLQITSICNAGFVLSSRGKKVLIDALFDPESLGCPSAAAAAAAMRSAGPPFDGADVVLITHSDPGHFDPRIVVSYLLHNPKAVLVSSANVFSLVQPRYPDVEEIRDRSRPITVWGGRSATITAGGVQVEVLSVPYGSVPNQGFLLNLGGFRVFHFGAADLDRSLLAALRPYHLPNRGIDVALVPYRFLIREDLLPVVTEGIGAAVVIPTAWGGDLGPVQQEVRTLFPQAVLIQPMETYTLSYPPAPPGATESTCGGPKKEGTP